MIEICSIREFDNSKINIAIVRRMKPMNHVIQESVLSPNNEFIKMSIDSKKELQSKLLVFYLESRHKILNNIIHNAYQIVTYLELQFNMHFEDDDLFDMLSFVERRLLIIRDE